MAQHLEGTTEHFMSLMADQRVSAAITVQPPVAQQPQPPSSVPPTTESTAPATTIDVIPHAKLSSAKRLSSAVHFTVDPPENSGNAAGDGPDDGNDADDADASTTHALTVGQQLHTEHAAAAQASECKQRPQQNWQEQPQSNQSQQPQKKLLGFSFTKKATDTVKRGFDFVANKPGDTLKHADTPPAPHIKPPVGGTTPNERRRVHSHDSGDSSGCDSASGGETSPSTSSSDGVAVGGDEKEPLVPAAKKNKIITEVDSAKLQSALAEQSKWVPLRLSDEERSLLGILEGALEVCEYTDKVDVAANDFGWSGYNSFGGGGGGKTRLIVQELREVLSLISGLYLASDYRAGQRIVQKSFKENEAFYQRIFEVGRRNKILNPDKMRNTYGKMMHMLQDAVALGNAGSTAGLPTSGCVGPIRTVHALLQHRGALAVLRDPLTLDATAVVSDVAAAADAAAARKAKAGQQLCERYCHDGGISEEEMRLALDSLADANAQQHACRGPVEAALRHLCATFPASNPPDFKHSLDIRYGEYGSKLNHSHAQHVQFVRQSLLLWREVQRQIYRLWLLADGDLLSSTVGYRLCNTGQGMNRVQPAPGVERAMSEVLHAVQAAARPAGWVGLSVVHLGDRDVPNALFFIDKYTQVPRILGPVVLAVERLDVLEKQRGASKIVKLAGGAVDARRYILRDFFRYGFDGSGSDGGSCIDGRLTSAWNWCSRVEKKAFYPLLLATGFSGFDGSFR
eukprot:TRINITY_DN5808_c0_g1_i1.p1 TRINITY_DN5808_c0_g1~~TRINITY_DN5808_c0_g1_i1.p1  ORF type:complete len:813 (+),score=227.14 TRINITY_DN5808_c0_g1_i1:222-2441(+)